MAGPQVGLQVRQTLTGYLIMESCEPPVFLICAECGEYIISERTRYDKNGKCYHETCFGMIPNEDKYTDN